MFDCNSHTNKIETYVAPSPMLVVFVTQISHVNTMFAGKRHIHSRVKVSVIVPRVCVLLA